MMIVLVRHSYHRVVWGRLQVTDSGHKRTLHRQSLLRVNRYSLGAHREPLDVRFAPKATGLLRRPRNDAMCQQPTLAWVLIIRL